LGLQWSRFMMIISGSFLQLCIGIFLNYTEIFKVDALNYFSMFLGFLMNILVFYMIV
jgi:hypothetical protein